MIAQRLALLIFAIFNTCFTNGEGTAQGALKISEPLQDRVIARVNGSNISESDILHLLTELPSEARQVPSSDLYRLLLDRAIDQVLVVQAAYKNNLDDDPNVKVRLQRAANEVLWEAFLQRQISLNMSKERIQQAFDMMTNSFSEEQIKARHILLASQEEAKAIIQKLKAGANFEVLAKEKSIGPSRDTGGDLGYFSRRQMVKEFSDVAFDLGIKEYSKTPVKTQFGWHVILVEGRRRAESPSMEQAMPQIRQEVTREILNEALIELRSQADIEVLNTHSELVRP